MQKKFEFDNVFSLNVFDDIKGELKALKDIFPDYETDKEIQNEINKLQELKEWKCYDNQKQ